MTHGWSRTICPELLVNDPTDDQIQALIMQMHNEGDPQLWGFSNIRLKEINCMSQSCCASLFFGARLIQQNSSF